MIERAFTYVGALALACLLAAGVRHHLDRLNAAVADTFARSVRVVTQRR